MDDLFEVDDLYDLDSPDLGILIVKKDGVIFSGSENDFIKKSFLESDLKDVYYIRSGESENFILINKSSLRTIIKQVSDARDFAYNTVSLELPDFDPLSEILIFRLNY